MTWLALTLALGAATAAEGPSSAVAGGPAASRTIPVRLASLAPSLSELVLELGAGQRLVGVSRFDEDPQLRQLPRLGGLLDPDLEAIVGLRPDLVLIAEANDRPSAMRQALETAGLKVLGLPADRYGEMLESIAKLGALLGAAPRARALRDELIGLLAQARQATANLRPVRVAVVIAFRPLLLAGRASYLQPLLEAAGGENVAKGELAWPASSAEQLVVDRPEVLIDGAWDADDAEGRRLLQTLQAGGTRVVRLPTALYHPGPRAVRLLPALQTALRPKPPTP